MLRFTIRDLLWLMAVVGIGVGWYATDSAWRLRYGAAQREYIEHLNKVEDREFEARAEVFKLKNGITVEEAARMPLEIPINVP